MQGAAFAEAAAFAVVPTIEDVSDKAASCVAVQGCDVGRVGNGQCDPRCNVTECTCAMLSLMTWLSRSAAVVLWRSLLG